MEDRLCPGDSARKRKGMLMESILRFFRGCISGLFCLTRRLGVRHRVCFFSRQSDRLTEDFALLQESLAAADPTMEIRTVCCRYRDRRDGLFRFLRMCLKSLFLAARAEVCVLDGYWPVICLLRDKKSLRVIQIWHSVGKIKQSGYQTLDRPSGRKSSTARAMCMHRNYDVIIAGGRAWDEYYCAAFDVDKSRLRNWGLPRLDRLSEAAGADPALLARHPELQGRIIVLYAPTYRTYPLELPENFFTQFPADRYALVCRYHPNQVFAGGPGRSDYPEEDIFDLLCACDYFITDYSSLALEAAALRKPTVYYLPDEERYLRENGVNIDLHQVMPACTFTAAEDVYRLIDGGGYPMEALRRYRQQYLPDPLGHATERITALILGNEK